MRKVTVTCDRCGFEKTYDNLTRYDELTGWAYITVYGPYKDVEVCPECIKSFIDIKEEKDDDKDSTG